MKIFKSCVGFAVMFAVYQTSGGQHPWLFFFGVWGAGIFLDGCIDGNRE